MTRLFQRLRPTSRRDELDCVLRFWIRRCVTTIHRKIVKIHQRWIFFDMIVEGTDLIVSADLLEETSRLAFSLSRLDILEPSYERKDEIDENMSKSMKNELFPEWSLTTGIDMSRQMFSTRRVEWRSCFFDLTFLSRATREKTKSTKTC